MHRSRWYLACALFTAGCVSSGTDFIAKDSDSQVVTLGAGKAVITEGDEGGWRLWYIIDPSTRTCWFKIGDSVGALDCCQLWRVNRAQRHLPWLNAPSCAAHLSTQQPK